MFWSVDPACSSLQVSVVEDKELEFDEILSAPLPKAPLEVSFRAHWLAIEGVQPLIPENPLPEGMDVVTTTKKRKAVEGEGEGADDTMVEEVLSLELQLYFEKVTGAVLQGSPHLLAAALQSLGSDPGLQALLPYLTQFITDEVTRSLKDLGVLNRLLSMTSALLSNPQLHVEPRLHQLMPAIMTCMVGRKLCKSSFEAHWSLRDRAADLLTFIVRRYASSYVTLQPRITSTLLYAFLDPERPLTTHYGAIVGLNALGAQTVSKMILPNVAAYASLMDLDGVDVSDVGGKRVFGQLKTEAGQAVTDKGGLKEGSEAGCTVDKNGASLRETWKEQSQIKRYEATRVRGVLLAAAGGCLRNNPVVFSIPVSVSNPDVGKEGGKEKKDVAEQEGPPPSAQARYQEISKVFGDSLMPYYYDPSDRICSYFL